MGTSEIGFGIAQNGLKRGLLGRDFFVGQKGRGPEWKKKGESGNSPFEGGTPGRLGGGGNPIKKKAWVKGGRGGKGPKGKDHRGRDGRPLRGRGVGEAAPLLFSSVKGPGERKEARELDCQGLTKKKPKPFEKERTQGGGPGGKKTEKAHKGEPVRNGLGMGSRVDVLLGKQSEHPGKGVTTEAIKKGVWERKNGEDR